MRLMEKAQTPETANIIRDARQRKYRTAKEYWEEHEAVLKTSYPHYSAIESGTKFPDIQLTIAIAKTLKIDLRLICHVWAKDQMPDAEAKAFFDPVPGSELQGMPSTVKMDLDEYYVFTEKQISALQSKQCLWDVLMLIMSFTDSTPPTESQIAKVMQIDPDEVSDAVEWLRNEGLVVSDRGHLKSRRKFFHLPNTEAFKEIRDLNFQRANRDLISKITAEQLACKEAARTTFTRRITRVQAQEITKRIDALIGHFGNLDNFGNELYSMTIGFGPRLKFQPNGKNA